MSAKTFWLILVAIVILGPFWVTHEIGKAVRCVYRWNEDYDTTQGS